MEKFKKIEKAKKAMRCVLIAMIGILVLTMVHDIVLRDWVHALCNMIWIGLACSVVLLTKQNDNLIDILERYDELTDKQQDKMKEQSALIGILKAELSKHENKQDEK